MLCLELRDVEVEAGDELAELGDDAGVVGHRHVQPRGERVGRTARVGRVDGNLAGRRQWSEKASPTHQGRIRLALGARRRNTWKSGSAPCSATASALPFAHFSTSSDIEKMPRMALCCDSATLPPASLIVRESAATRPLRSGPAAVTTTAVGTLLRLRQPSRRAMDGSDRRSMVPG